MVPQRAMLLQRKALMVVLFCLIIVLELSSLINGEISKAPFVEMSRRGGHYHDDHMQRMQAFKASLTVRRELASPDSPSPAPAPGQPMMQGMEQQPGVHRSGVYRVTSYGADPAGETDSTEALLKAMAEAFNASRQGSLMKGIANLGGALIDLEGGNYLISKPLRFPGAGVGNLMISGGTLQASDSFPTDGYLIDLSASSSPSSYNYEFITLRDLLLDCNYRGGGIQVTNSLRTSIDNCYIAHFSSDGILVQGGHETYIRNSFLGQHITAGGDPGERNFSGTAISLMGNDNAVTDVVIFSAAVGVMVSGQANTLSGVHCYNKATGFGGTGIYLKLPGLTQTRILNCYMDYTSIVAEDPVQLTVSNSFFLGDAYILLKSIKGIANGVTIVDNMFSGSGKGIEIVQLDQTQGSFKQIDQVVVDRNNVKGMNVKTTVAKGSVAGNGTTWTVDFSPTLLFPNLIRHVQYSLSTNSIPLPNHALQSISGNQVVITSNYPVSASVFAAVDQSS